MTPIGIMFVNMKGLLLLICVGLTLAARRSYERYVIEYAEHYFEEFITTYNKNYENETEKQIRFEIFKNNLIIINEKNVKSNSTVYGINFFADLTTEEFLQKYTGLNGIGASNCRQQTRRLKKFAAPESFDWRDQGKVSRVKDQGKCGSCWAFGATGNLESQYAIKYNQVLEFSEQQLVDCDGGSKGCDGAPYIEEPFLYWTENMGAMLEEDYPYVSSKESCKFDPSKVKVNVTGCVQYRPESEDQLKEVLASTGPLSIAVDATDFQQYGHGIFEGCSENSQINHVVLLVGYGSEDGVPYWLIKNSWGEIYGEEGYIKLPRGRNACGIINDHAVSVEIA